MNMGENCPSGEVRGLLSFGEVEARLVEAMQLCWQGEGGRWPFASDGPWHLVQRELYGPDVDKDAPLPRLPLSRAQMARRDEAIGWLAHAPEEHRRLIVLAVRELAKPGTKRVPWRALLPKMGLTLGADGLRMRYERALGEVCRCVNRRNARDMTGQANNRRD
jgi:hypothetical protein